MDGLQRAASLEAWAQAALYLGILFGGLIGLAPGFNAGEPLLMLIGGIIGGGLGALSGYVGSLPLVGIACALRDIDALGRSRR